MAGKLTSLSALVKEAKPAVQWIRHSATLQRTKRGPLESRKRLRKETMKDVLSCRRLSLRNNRMIDLFFLENGFSSKKLPYDRLNGNLKGEWSKHEDERLLHKMVTIGRTNWTAVSASVGKSVEECKNRYNFLVRADRFSELQDEDSVAFQRNVAFKEAEEKGREQRKDEKLKRVSS